MKKKLPWINITDISPREIAPHIEWKDVYLALKYYYSGYNWKGHEKAFYRIKDAPKKRPKAGQRLEVYGFNTFFIPDKEFESRYGIHIVEIKNIDHMTNRPKEWGMSFRDWDQLINTKFADYCFRRYTMVDLMAHFIYELTWYGDERTTVATGKGLLERVEKLDKEFKEKKKV